MPTDTATFSPGDRVLYRFREHTATAVHGDRLAVTTVDGYQDVAEAAECFPYDTVGRDISGRYQGTLRLIEGLEHAAMLDIPEIRDWLLRHWSVTMRLRGDRAHARCRMEDVDEFRHRVESTLAGVRSIEVRGCRLFGG